jgi:hypothetical protein
MLILVFLLLACSSAWDLPDNLRPTFDADNDLLQVREIEPPHMPPSDFESFFNLILEFADTVHDHLSVGPFEIHPMNPFDAVGVNIVGGDL